MERDKEICIIAMAVIAIVAMFQIPQESAQIVNPIIAAIAGVTVGRYLPKKE